MEVYLNKLIITIDGPSGSGKEKISKYIAKKYKLYHLDSGILYRRLAAIFSKRDVNLNDEQDIKKILKEKWIYYRISSKKEIHKILYKL